MCLTFIKMKTLTDSLLMHKQSADTKLFCVNWVLFNLITVYWAEPWIIKPQVMLFFDH
jgi:hypothetical protein